MRPKFCVGEEVDLRSKNAYADIDKIEVVYVEHASGTMLRSGGQYTGFLYGLAGRPHGVKLWTETALRKSPPDASNSFSAMMGKLKQPAKA